MWICDNGVMREMTADEEYTANHLPDPEDMIDDAEAFALLIGDAT